MIGIYKVTNLINNKIYIGQSVHIETRWKSHRNDCFNPNLDKYNCVFYNAIRKYGIDNFKFEVIEECSINQLNEREQYWIKYYNTYIGFKNCQGYNMTLGGNTAPPHELLNYEQVQEIKKLLTTTYLSQEDIGKQFHVSSMSISDINRGNTWIDEDTEYPLRKINIRANTLEHNNLPVTKEELQQILINNNGNFSQTAKQLKVHRYTIYRWCKLLELPNSSDKYKVKKQKRMGNNYTNTPKPVYMIDKDTNEILKKFDSMSEAANFLGKSSALAHISLVCQGKNKTAYGYKWSWVN